MFEFGLIKKKDEFFIMKHLLIEHEEPINKNFLFKTFKNYFDCE